MGEICDSIQIYEKNDKLGKFCTGLLFQVKTEKNAILFYYSSISVFHCFILLKEHYLN